MNLAFFQESPTIHPVDRKEQLAIQPCIFNDNKGIVSFAFDVYPDHYLVNEFTLKTKWSVRRKDKSPLQPADIVAPVTCAHHTMWSDVQLKLNDSLIEASNYSYPYKAYFLSTFAHSKEVKDYRLSYEQFLYPDECS